MKFSVSTIIVGVIIVLIGVNVFIFIRGLQLGNEISFYETELATFKEQNSELEHKIYKLESHVWTASLAAELEYGKYNDPMYIEQPRFALK
ncbi:hypothetical protein CO051_04865 [Candidatus Roizmanbacteria bacterium CG_4_9_14_0_2_um_filter_39_13]|uniref:Cell division protein FtsL n=2 Tax=Candidatus Roizmaniibacteriota TaxID=1752723 RepID=A0A2M8EXQ2_9BACT|nr:MAG: hypothetical protein COY15_04920 [Candidatus Roizmanbacteria bacterium CG_4_10_14_0_2_um_filter_39_12]PJC30825.1 MAG: hypothetical protein CO051_04865 [Candidatus Roizmanbacteria bacterium CG_4_9_14_0_2_um_filter_39_13]PJE62258.1 MAG: hypothetical protein COU87_00270 [Candidatus Roizmanbacteria bacterium CG10_big_fil_rev_8_21_14_0_10_39_12]